MQALEIGVEWMSRWLLGKTPLGLHSHACRPSGCHRPSWKGQRGKPIVAVFYAYYIPRNPHKTHESPLNQPWTNPKSSIKHYKSPQNISAFLHTSWNRGPRAAAGLREAAAAAAPLGRTQSGHWTHRQSAGGSIQQLVATGDLPVMFDGWSTPWKR